MLSVLLVVAAIMCAPVVFFVFLAWCIIVLRFLSRFLKVLDG